MKILIEGLNKTYVNFDNIFVIEVLEDCIVTQTNDGMRDGMTERTLFKGSAEQIDLWFHWLETELEKCTEGVNILKPSILI